MPKYLVQASYSPEGMQGVMKEGGSARRDAIGRLVEAVGASMEGFYFAFGDDDVAIIVDAPDNPTAAGMSMVVNASGAVRSHVTVLLTPEEVDQATQLSYDYRPPGT
jgi:uncharacterized protein with GYD domain